MQRRDRIPLTQPAATLSSESAAPFTTKCGPIDRLLGGGLPRKHVLEISGPPGTPKGVIVVGLVRSFLNDSPDGEVVFLGKLSALYLLQ